MVAKSYQNLKVKGKPFKENGRDYVIVITNHGNEKKVRWYPDKPQKDVLEDTRARFCFWPDDTLYVARGPKEAIDQFFTQDTQFFGRYNSKWGWYIGTWVKSDNVSTEKIRAHKARMKELGISLYKMPYSLIANKEGKMLPWTEQPDFLQN